MSIQIRNELTLSKKEKQQIANLLTASFGGYPSGTSYLKHPPGFRILYMLKEGIAGQLSAYHRNINIDGNLCEVFWVSDLCVGSKFRQKGYATKILEALEKRAKQAGVDYLIAIASNASLYRKNGFKQKDVKATWLMISNHESFGISKQKIDHSLMVKNVHGDRISIKSIDFLGPLF